MEEGCGTARSGSVEALVKGSPRGVPQGLTGRALAPILTSLVLGCGIATPFTSPDAKRTERHPRGAVPHRTSRFNLSSVLPGGQPATGSTSPAFRATHVARKAGFRLPGFRASAASDEDHSLSPLRSSSHTTPEPLDSTRPHPVPPRVPQEVLRRSRRRERHAGVSCPHVHHETARNAQHACLMPRRALSIASIRICVRWCDSWPGRRHASALSRTRSRHVTITSQVATDEGRSLRSLLLREPAGRIDR